METTRQTMNERRDILTEIEFRPHPGNLAGTTEGIQAHLDKWAVYAADAIGAPLVYVKHDRRGWVVQAWVFGVDDELAAELACTMATIPGWVMKR